jgi:adenylate cyclase
MKSSKLAPLFGNPPSPGLQGPLPLKGYRFGQFAIDTRSATLRRDGAMAQLRPKSFEVLVYLVENAGELVLKSELIDHVWPTVIVTENSLAQCIKDIRQVLGDDGQKMLETVAKRGYVFAPPVLTFDLDGPESEAGKMSEPPLGVPAQRLVPTQIAPPVAPSPAGRPARTAVMLAGFAAILAIASGVWWMAPGAPPARDAVGDAAPPGKPAHADTLSIAVLPFSATESSDLGDYFSSGISEDIAAALGRFPDLSVASPNVVSRFHSVGASVEDIERQLKVRYLVEGSIRRVPERVRIAVRLTDLAHGTLLWSDAYDAPAATILTIQEDIVVRVTGALAVKLTNLERVRVAGKSIGSMEAYDFVLRGRELLTRLNRVSHSQAREMFERAIELDPRYAAAYVGLGRVDLSAVALGWTPNAEEALARAATLARKAISLDEFNPAAHVLLGRAYARMGDYERAIDTLRRAIALNPSDPESHAGLGDALLWSGESASAIKALETAIAIDPRLSGEDLFSLGTAYFIDNQFSESVRVFERATTRNEGNSFIYAMLAAAYVENHRDSESQSAAEEVRRLNPFFDVGTFGSLFKNPKDRDKIATALRKSGL